MIILWMRRLLAMFDFSPRIITAVFGLLILTILPVSVLAEESSIAEVRVDVRLKPGTQELEGTALIRVKAGAADEVDFYLAPKAVVARVTLNDRDLEYFRKRGILTIPLPSVKNEQVITIRYSCRFDDPLPNKFISHENPSFGVRSVISNAGTFLDKSAGWYPHPVKGLDILIVEVSAPPLIEAVTEGERIAHRNDAKGSSSRWHIRSPPAPIPLSAAAYRIDERRHGRHLLYTFFTDTNADMSQRYLDAAATYIDFYEQLFGPYPFAKFAVVENFLPTGYGFRSYTLLGSGLLRMQSVMHTTLPHEIAHCWWGNSVMVDFSNGNWSEGLVTYLAEHLLAERRSAAEAKSYRYKLISDYAALVPADKEFPLREFSSRNDPVSRSIGYNKGAMVFHMIRQRVGDDAFFDTLRDLARGWKDRQVGWDEIISAFERVSEVPLGASAKLWLDKTGGTVLEAEELEVKQSASGWDIRGTITFDRPSYQSFVKVLVTAGTTEVTHDIAVKGKRNEFRIHVNDRPVLLTLDPDNDLFRVINQEELPATVNRIKGSEELTVITAEGRNYDENLKLLIESLGNRDVTYMTETDIVKKLPATDILFYGYPAAGSIVNGLPPGVTIRRKEFEIYGNSFNKPEDFLFIVFPNPSARKRVIAICFPLSEYAARSSVPKITHYGRFGYLVFSSGVNKLMGSFQGSSRGVVYRLSQGSAE